MPQGLSPKSPRGLSPGRSPVSPRTDVTQSMAEYENYNVRGLSQVLRAAEQQRRAQFKRLQHLKLATEKEAAKQRQHEIRKELDNRKQETIDLERRYKEEALAISKAEAEFKRQQTIANGNMVQEMKKMQAVQQCKKVDERAEEVRRERAREAAVRKQEAEDREMYRQEVLVRSAIIEEKRRQAALMKEEQLEAQLHKKSMEAAMEEEARADERNQIEEHRQMVALKAEMDEELRKQYYQRHLQEKEQTVQRNMGELEENRRNKQHYMRQLEMERQAKVAHAQHLDALKAQQTFREYSQKIGKVEQIEAEREQVLWTMRSLRAEMSLQEEAFKDAIHQMKVSNRYDSAHLMDLSQSMTDVSRFLSTSGRSTARSLTPPPFSRMSRPHSAPNRKTKGRPSSKGGATTPVAVGVPTSPAYSQFVQQRVAHSLPTKSKRPPANRRPRPSSAQKSEASVPRTKLNFSPPESAGSNRPQAESSPAVVRAESPVREAWPQKEEVGEPPAVARQLTAKQMELKQLIEREQAAERDRQVALKRIADPQERQRLIKIFTAEREMAKERILSLSYV